MQGKRIGRFRESFGCSHVLKEIAAGGGIAVSDLIAIIDAERQDANLSSAIRLFVLGVYRDHISASGLSDVAQRKRPGVL